MPDFTMTLERARELDPDFDECLNDYPIFDEAYRTPLNEKIIAHFLKREIGTETISMFRLFLKRKMSEIMPLYNQHYVLSRLAIDPLETVSIKTITSTTAETTADGTGTNTSTSDAKSRAVSSETPQTVLSGTGDYATALQDSTGNTTASGTTTEDRTETQTADAENTVSGFQGHSAALVWAARQALVNVDMMVIAELESLFMLVWSTGEEYTGRQWPYYGVY